MPELARGRGRRRAGRAVPGPARRRAGHRLGRGQRRRRSGWSRHFGVRLVVGMHAIPWPAPHTRPVNVTVHGNDPTLTVGQPAVGGLARGPGQPGRPASSCGSASVDRPAMGFAAHVPHYLVQAEFPRGALVLLQSLCAATGPGRPARRAASGSRGVRRRHLDPDRHQPGEPGGGDDPRGAVRRPHGGPRGPSTPADPSAASDTDIAAQVEAFLAELDHGRVAVVQGLPPAGSHAGSARRHRRGPRRLRLDLSDPWPTGREDRPESWATPADASTRLATTAIRRPHHG